MPHFLQFATQLSPLSEEAAEGLAARLQTKTISKGGYLLKNGSVCRYLFFINKGLTKTHFYHEDKQFIMRFFAENALFTVLDSYVQQSPSAYMITALETTTVTCIAQRHMESLCKKHHCIETFLRKLVSMASVNMMKRISEMLEENAAQRYHNFVHENGDLLQRISLGDLASYLGITQVSLSRIRAGK